MKRAKTNLKKIIREQWPVRQGEIAAELNLHYTRLSQIVGGDQPTTEEVLKLCEYFKKDESEIFRKLL